jgi:glycosyltransferase involved in cell wall biosynthesis
MDTATACVIVKDEAPYMAEWLAHYLTLGFDRIFVYDNGSTDPTRSIVSACALEEPAINLFDWPSRPGEAPQLTAYNDALRSAGTNWIGYFDADELLVLKGFESIGEFLARFPAQAGAIAVNWRMFGSNGETLYRDAPQAERFRLSGPNDMIKSIVRVGCAHEIDHVHGPRLSRGHYFNERFERIDLAGQASTGKASYVNAQLNHYVLRSAEEYRDKKARGYAARAPGDLNYPQRDAEFWANCERYNRVDDHAIDPWVARSAALRRRFEAIARRFQPLRNASPGVASLPLGGHGPAAQPAPAAVQKPGATGTP